MKFSEMNINRFSKWYFDSCNEQISRLIKADLYVEKVFLVLLFYWKEGQFE